MEIELDELEFNNEYNLKENLIYIEEIDQGAFGKVIHAKDKRTKKDYALKIINKSEANLTLINRMKEEILILKKLENNNIVKYYNHWENRNKLFIKMEYLKYGTLKQWIEKNKSVNEEQASTIIKQVLKAIAYLHQNQICHRDLKPENIMFSKENDLYSIKIIDFGLSLQNFDSLLKSDYSGTMIYMAPEELERKSYYLSIDIWSIGILMYMLLNKGEHPFYKEKDTKEIFLKKLKENKINEMNSKISLMAMDLLKKLLEYNPIKRYKASDALKHPWITRNPDDKIPQTLNEQLNSFNLINNAKELMMISIFLNHFKKNHIHFINKIKNIGKIELGKYNYKQTKITNIFKIGDEYIKKCEFFSKTKKDKMKELRKKYLDVSKSGEISKEKNNNNNNSNSNTNSTSNNNLSNSNSNLSNSNNHLLKHCKTNSAFSKNNNFIYQHKLQNQKEVPLIFIDSLNNISTRKKKKIFLSEKKNNYNNSIYNKKYKNMNYQTDANNNINNLNNINSLKKKKIFLGRTSTKPFNLNPINNINNNFNEEVVNFINNNINNIKPINLFLREKNINKLNPTKTNSRKDLAHINIENIIKENERTYRKKNTFNNLKLPNINSNSINIYNTKKSKK